MTFRTNLHRATHPARIALNAAQKVAPALVLLGAAASGPSGCSQINYSGSAQRSGARAEVDRAVQRIDEETLREHGLETLWTQQALQGRFKRVYVVGDDLFAVEERTSGQGPAALRTRQLNVFDRKDGLRRWVFDLKAPLKHAPFIYRYPRGANKEDEVFIVQGDKVYCLDLRYGTTLWSAAMPFSISSGATASESHYFVGSLDHRYFGIPKRREIEDWFWFLKGEVRTNSATQGIYTYFTSTDGSVHKFHDSKGAEDDGKWIFRAGDRVLGAPTVVSGKVFVGSNDYKLYCLRDVDGSKEWDFQAQAPVPETPLVVRYRPNKNFVFCIADDKRPSVNTRTLWAVDAANGNGDWRYTHVDTLLAVGRDTVYVLTDKRSQHGVALVGLQGESGKERFAIPMGGFDFVPRTAGVQSPRETQHGILYFIDDTGLIQAVGEKL